MLDIIINFNTVDMLRIDSIWFKFESINYLKMNYLSGFEMGSRFIFYL